MSWVRWEKIAIPKALGGWGLKNIFLFVKALAAKVAWRLLQSQSLWTRVVFQKYIAPLTLIDWVRQVDKTKPGCSVIWKALVLSFGLIGSGLVWRVGDGRKLRVGLDPWVGSGRDHILPLAIRTILEDQGFFFLSSIADPGTSTIWHQGWINGRELGLSMVQQVSWDTYISALRLAQIRLVDREDELVWMHHPSGKYTPKLGYI